MRKWLGFALVLVVTLFARGCGAASESVWYDEAATLSLIDTSSLADYLEAGRQVDAYKVPLYFVLEYAWWHAVSSTVIGLRGLSILVSLVTVAALYWGCFRLWGAWTAVTAALYFALSKYFIFYGQEIRMYALMYLFALASWFALNAAVRGRRGAWGLNAAFNLLLIQTHLFGIVSISAQFLFLVMENARNWRRALTWSAVHLAVVFTIAPWMPLFAGDERAMMWIPMPSVATLLNTYFLVDSGATVYGDYPLPVVPQWIGLAIAAVAIPTAGIGMRAILRADGDRQARLMLLCWMLAPPLFMFVASHMLRPCYVDRYALYAAFPFLILTGMGISTMRPAARAGVGSLLAALCVVNVCAFDRPSRPDLSGAADQIRFNSEAGDRIVTRGMGYEFCLRVYIPDVEESRVLLSVPIRRSVRDTARGQRTWFVLDTLDANYASWTVPIDEALAKGRIVANMQMDTPGPRPVRVMLLEPAKTNSRG